MKYCVVLGNYYTKSNLDHFWTSQEGLDRQIRNSKFEIGGLTGGDTPKISFCQKSKIPICTTRKWSDINISNILHKYPYESVQNSLPMPILDVFRSKHACYFPRSARKQLKSVDLGEIPNIVAPHHHGEWADQQSWPDLIRTILALNIGVLTLIVEALSGGTFGTSKC